MRADIESLLGQVPHLTIDLAAVTFVDCAALSTLLWARTRAQDFGGHVTLVGRCAALSRILELTSLTGELVLHPEAPQ